MLNSPKTALITGAARRIGAVIARTLHQQGLNVVIHYRNSQVEAESLAIELNQQRANSATTLQADLCQAEPGEVIQGATVAWGRLDVLVNNAASFFPTTMGEVTDKQWHTLIDTNLKAPFFLAQAAAAELSQHNGSIINIIDIHGLQPLRNHAVYSIAKSGLVMLTKALAKELAPTVRVNGVSPAGAALWPEGENALDEATKQRILAKIPLQCEGSAKAIADAVYFFIVQDYITGQILAIDGGRSIALS